MDKRVFQQINERLDDHEKRIRILEGVSIDSVIKSDSVDGKQKTLREIVKGRKFRNGQEQIAVIVGYYEKMLGKLIYSDAIKEEWIKSKMGSKYDKNFLRRAQDELVRIHPDRTCDLTQSGEELFDGFLKDESANATSK